MMKNLAIGPLLALAVVFVAACGPAEESIEPAPESDPEEAMTHDEPTHTGLQTMIASARSDLAERLNVAEQDIEILQAREVTWRDGAMGCPEPDMMYTQALVRGYYIQMRANDEEYAYHSSRDGQPFLCPADRSQSPLDEGSALY